MREDRSASGNARIGRIQAADARTDRRGGLRDNAGNVVELALSEVAEGVFELRLPIPFEDGLVNVFLFADGDDVDLLDCGMNSEESVDAILAAVKELGAKRIRRLVVTHIHPDHYGAAGTLAGDGRADLYLHRLEVPLVNPRYVELDGAELLDMGRRKLRVEWTPGHSPGHICLYESHEKLLFAGDHMLPDLSPNIGLHPQSTPDPLHEYLDGLARMAAYEPALILPAHGRPFKDAASRVATLAAHHHRRLDQILEIVAGGERSAWNVALDLWGPRENFYEKRLALQEGLAHLQALAVEGRIEKRFTPSAVGWRPPLVRV